MKHQNLFILLLLLFFTYSIYAGNYFDVYGAHPRNNGMANAVTSFVNDVSAIFYNPAGLGMPSRLEALYYQIHSSKKKEVHSHHSQLKLQEYIKSFFYSFLEPLKEYPKERSQTPIHEVSIGFYYAKPVNHVRFDLYNPQSSDLKKIRDHYLTLGISLNLNSLFDFNRIVRFGLYAGLPGTGNLALVNDVNPTTHRFLQNGVSNERPIIHAGIGIEIWKNHLSIGAGIQTMLKGKGAILMKDVSISPDPTIPNQQAILELKPLMMPQFGIMFHYGKFLTGINYRRESYAHIDPLGAQAQTTLLAIQFDFDMALLDLYSPRTVSFGMGYQVLENLKIAVDFAREYWGLFRHSRTKEYVYSPIEDEILRKNIRIPIVQFKDINIVRFGFEWDWKNPWKIPLTIRAGIARKPTPVPDLPNEYNWMDNDRNIYTAGISFAYLPDASNRLRSPIIIDFVIENQQFRNRRIEKYSPTQKNPNYSYGGYAWSFGTSLTVKL